MAGTAETVRSLVREDPEMEDAIVTVLARAADNDGQVEWADVNDDLTSGQWGRLIEKGLLVDGEEGFEVSDPEAAREALEDDEPEEPDDASWTKWDKIAAVTAVAMMPGYYFDPIRSTVGETLDIVLGPLTELLPFYAVILVMAVLTGFNSTIFQGNMVDMDKMSYYQQKMQDIQDREKAAKERGDEEAVEEIRQEQIENMGENLGMFKEQFRPMGWIMLLTIPIFLWMYWAMGQPVAGPYETLGATEFVLPLIGEVRFNQGGTGPVPFPSWIVWYFLASMSITQVIRKALNVQTQPT
jgi:uncharacterized membrane protein (DUF106 family)